MLAVGQEAGIWEPRVMGNSGPRGNNSSRGDLARGAHWKFAQLLQPRLPRVDPEKDWFQVIGLVLRGVSVRYPQQWSQGREIEQS